MTRNIKGVITPAVPSSIEVMQQLGLAINEPKRELIALIHSDGDTDTTIEAVAVDKRITTIATAAGKPVDEAMATEALAGLAHGTSTQSTMAKHVEQARHHEAAGAEIARASADAAVAATETAKARLAVTAEEISHPTLGRGTRAQFELLHDELQHAAAFREAGGDYAHQDEPPARWIVLAVKIVLSLSEAMLVTRRIANASWTSPSTMALFVALSLITFIFVDYVTHHTGKAIRDYREMHHAAIDLTARATDDGGVR